MSESYEEIRLPRGSAEFKETPTR